MKVLRGISTFLLSKGVYKDYNWAINKCIIHVFCFIKSYFILYCNIKHNQVYQCNKILMQVVILQKRIKALLICHFLQLKVQYFIK